MSREKHREGEPLVYPCTYRKEVTDAEYRAYHGMKAWPFKCPKGFRVIDFRASVRGEIIIDERGNPYTTTNGYTTPYPILILEKIESELPPITDAEFRAHHLSIALRDLCPDGYRVIDYRNSKFGDTVVDTDGSAYSPSCGLAYPVLIIEKIEPELPPITKDTVPIDWVIPTDADAIHRPEVEVTDLAGQLEAGHGTKATLLAVADNGLFITAKKGTPWVYCRMNAKQREAGQ